MDIAFEFANYLVTAGFGMLGTTIFVGQIPDSINGVWVERIGGQPNNYVPIEEAVLNVYAKDVSASAAVTKLETIKRYVHRMHNTSTTNAYVYTFLVIGDIETIQRDPDYAKVFKLTVQVMYRATSLIS